MEKKKLIDGFPSCGSKLKRGREGGRPKTSDLQSYLLEADVLDILLQFVNHLKNFSSQDSLFKTQILTGKYIL